MKSMRFIKLNRDKTPKEKLNISYDYEEVAMLPDIGVLIQEPYVVLDIDDNNEYLKLKELIIEKGVKCNIMKTTRGGHFWFKSTTSITNNVNIKTPLGVTVDIRSWGKLCYTKVKQDNKFRVWHKPLYDFEELDELPFWLKPIQHKVNLVDLRDGDGRNDTLYKYIIILMNYLSIDEIKYTFDLINDYILKDRLNYKELETILRDESFINVKPMFFEKNRFLFDRFAIWLNRQYSIYRRDTRLFIYNDKYHVSDMIMLEKLMIDHIPTLSRKQRMEVLDYLRLIVLEAPDPYQYHITVDNGVIDFRTGKLEKHSPHYFTPNILNVKYNPDIEECKVVDDFMDRITEGNKDIERLIYEMVGYSMMQSARFQKSFILYGDGSNGKSTFLEMLINILGDSNVSNLSIRETTHNFKLSDITDKLANIADDLDDQYITDSSVFKKLVTGEEILVDKKHNQPYTIKNVATMIFATNNLPNMADKSHGMLRRLCLVPFNAYITQSDPHFDPFIIDKLITEEAKSYVLNKALVGLRSVYRNQGFTEPTVVKDLMDEYYREVNNVIRYLEHIEENIEDKITKDLFRDYQLWCADVGETAYKVRRFNTEIRKRGYETIQKRVSGFVETVWVDKSQVM